MRLENMNERYNAQKLYMLLIRHAVIWLHSRRAEWQCSVLLL